MTISERVRNDIKMNIRVERIIFLFAGFCLFANIVSSQNLVPNNSFECYETCPAGISGSGSANSKIPLPWIAPTSVGSSDYFNTCNTGSVNPYSNVFGQQEPYRGEGYVGLYCYLKTSPLNRREYVQVELLQPLESGKCYNVSFYVSLADTMRYAVGSIGAFFSYTSIGGTGVQYLDPIPHVASPSGQTLSDKEGWTLISGSFTANGGERFMTIGNFELDSNIDTVYVNNNGNGDGNWDAAYYYIDHVIVMGCGETLYAFSKDTLCYGDTLTITQKDGLQTIWNIDDTTPQISFEVTTDTLIYLSVIDTGNCFTYNDSIDIEVTSDPYAQIIIPDSVCLGDTIHISSIINGDHFLWNTGSATDSFFFDVVSENTSYSLSVMNACGVAKDSVSEIAFPIIIDAGKDTSIILGNSVVLMPSGGNAYTWDDELSLSCLICEKPVASPDSKTTYYVIAVDPNGCSGRDSVTVFTRQVPFLPNAFSPNGDGYNDQLVITMKGYENVKYVELSIFDRFGNLLYKEMNATEWDGKVANMVVERGVYLYRIEIGYILGETITKSSNVTVVY